MRRRLRTYFMKVFARIAERWGTVVETKNCSLEEDQSLVAVKVLIRTLDMNPIDKILSIIDAKSFKVRVSKDAKEIVGMSTSKVLESTSDEDSVNSEEEGDFFGKRMTHSRRKRVAMRGRTKRTAILWRIEISSTPDSQIEFQ
ncbi:hypothetical protein L6452_37561 [Arctium lappa]|uniref:Uncharacterized protein n=1 Tax=Arctium lappa TaxID=4217 RepID=A0ACB8Y4F9_ARCLA|nr:hypothetical protein L6452_37561 [Arctium lappa]